MDPICQEVWEVVFEIQKPGSQLQTLGSILNIYYILYIYSMYNVHLILVSQHIGLKNIQAPF